MEWVREYLLSITAAALVCGIVTTLIGKTGTLGTVIKVMAGIFMALTVVSPWTTLDMNPISTFSDNLLQEAEAWRDSGENMSREAIADGIKTEAESYILDKADALGLDLSVEITVSESNPPVLQKVRMKGAVSPYAKQELVRILREELGISEEDQVWT